MVAARSLGISTTLEQRAARLFFDRALRFVMRHPPLLSVGPTGRIAAVRRCAAYLLPAGPPTPFGQSYYSSGPDFGPYLSAHWAMLASFQNGRL